MRLDKETSRILRDLVRLSAVGMELAISIVIGLGIGLFIDKKLHSSPWGMLAFLSLEL